MFWDRKVYRPAYAVRIEVDFDRKSFLVPKYLSKIACLIEEYLEVLAG